MTAPDLIIFDCDGVLIDSEPLASRTLSQELRAAGVDLSPRDVNMQFTGKAESEIKRICVVDYGLTDADAVFSEWHEALYRAFAQELVPMEGMVELVSALATAKCVASNSSRARLRMSLGRTALWAAFAPHIYGADSVAHPKPAPDLLLHCAAQLGRGAATSIMVDDSPHGIKAAIAAGMTSIGFVDPGDPRPNRDAVLKAAGAQHIATGSAQLAELLGALGCRLNAPSSARLEATSHG